MFDQLDPHRRLRELPQVRRTSNLMGTPLIYLHDIEPDLGITIDRAREAITGLSELIEVAELAVHLARNLDGV